MASGISHNREIGSGVPAGGEPAIPARSVAFVPEDDVTNGPTQWTRCAAGSQDGRRQSRAGSFAEAVANVVAGYLLALLAQQMVLPVFGIHVGFTTHAAIAVVFTLSSLIRSYILRRVFEHIAWQRRLMGGTR